MIILVEMFSVPGCDHCVPAREALRAVVAGLEQVRWRDVDVLAELDYAVELGVLSPPAIAIDGVLVFPAMPEPARLRAELLRRLGEEG